MGTGGGNNRFCYPDDKSIECELGRWNSGCSNKWQKGDFMQIAGGGGKVCPNF